MSTGKRAKATAVVTQPIPNCLTSTTKGPPTSSWKRFPPDGKTGHTTQSRTAPSVPYVSSRSRREDQWSCFVGAEREVVGGRDRTRPAARRRATRRVRSHRSVSFRPPHPDRRYVR